MFRLATEEAPAYVPTGAHSDVEKGPGRRGMAPPAPFFLQRWSEHRRSIVAPTGLNNRLPTGTRSNGQYAMPDPVLQSAIRKPKSAISPCGAAAPALSTAFHNYGDVWRPRFELISRNDDEGVPERYVEEE